MGHTWDIQLGIILGHDSQVYGRIAIQNVNLIIFIEIHLQSYKHKGVYFYMRKKYYIFIHVCLLHKYYACIYIYIYIYICISISIWRLECNIPTSITLNSIEFKVILSSWNSIEFRQYNWETECDTVMYIYIYIKMLYVIFKYASLERIGYRHLIDIF